jgi:hypothetical protein
MAIQTTGFFQNPQTKTIYDSPKLILVPHLEYPGVINMDVNIDQGGTVPYQNLDRKSLPYNLEIADPYSQLLDALENYVLEDLQKSTPINEKCKFEKVVKLSPSLEENLDI